MIHLGKSNTDSELISGIIQDGPKLRFWENKLYHTYVYLIRQGSWKHKLTDDECSMAYSDTILTVIENIRAAKFEGKAEIKTYVTQIFNNKCVDLVRKNTTNKQQVNKGGAIEDYLHILPDETRSVVERMIEEYDMVLLKSRISTLGDKCRQIIKAWGEGFMDQEIAVQMGYQSGAVVKTSRLRCLDKLRELYGKR
jgi:RNA polymerase sigma factor (sigma-70 family)